MILNERELKAANARLKRLAVACESETVFAQILQGFPPDIAERVGDALKVELRELKRAIYAYEETRDTSIPSNDFGVAARDPGIALIVARIANGLSQKELGRRLGVREQQVQRWESDRYSTISLKNLKRLALLLGVEISTKISEKSSFQGIDQILESVDPSLIRNVLKHGKNQGWFGDEFGESDLIRFFSENRIDYGRPALLRTGLIPNKSGEEFLLEAWRARITGRVISKQSTIKADLDLSDLAWLNDLRALTTREDGISEAEGLLANHGILFLVEPNLPGQRLDGASFLFDELPVVAMTLRVDSIDSFWFTLLHEIGHVILHLRLGLSEGFFDDIENRGQDAEEDEANRFAENILIPEEKWRTSLARITNKENVVEKFAQKIGVHPSIVFGRIRYERDNYAIFSKKIGRGEVRKRLILHKTEG